MCHPGRPRPHGEGHCASTGSSLFAPFQSAKSRGSRFARAGPSAAACMASGRCPDNWPYAANVPDVEVDITGAVGGRVGVPVRDQLLDQLVHLGTWPVARGSYVGGSTPSRA
jgi:hypothetical protein